MRFGFKSISVFLIPLILVGCGISPQENGVVYTIPSTPAGSGVFYNVPVGGSPSSSGTTYNVPVNAGVSSQGTSYHVN